MHSPQLQSPLLLAALALAALTVSLLLAFASATAPRSSTQARETTAETPIAAPAAQPPAVSTAAGADAEHENDAGGATGNGPSQPLPSLVDQPPPLWALLAPWAFAVDAIAVLGLVALLIVRYNARRRRGPRM